MRYYSSALICAYYYSLVIVFQKCIPPHLYEGMYTLLTQQLVFIPQQYGPPSTPKDLPAILPLPQSFLPGKYIPPLPSEGMTDIHTQNLVVLTR